MFRVVHTLTDVDRWEVADVWEVAIIARAVELLGWRGQLRGPVSFVGMRFLAVCCDEPFGPPGSGWLRGCVVPGTDANRVMQEASVLAGYASRAVVLRGCADVAGVQLEAAILDQGVVVECSEGLRLVSEPGPVVSSPLQEGDRWQTHARWRELREAIGAARWLASIV